MGTEARISLERAFFVASVLVTTGVMFGLFWHSGPLDEQCGELGCHFGATVAWLGLTTLALLVGIAALVATLATRKYGTVALALLAFTAGSCAAWLVWGPA